jgi:hypothetical protein
MKTLYAFAVILAALTLPAHASVHSILSVTTGDSPLPLFSENVRLVDVNSVGEVVFAKSTPSVAALTYSSLATLAPETLSRLQDILRGIPSSKATVDLNAGEPFCADRTVKVYQGWSPEGTFVEIRREESCHVYVNPLVNQSLVDLLDSFERMANHLGY